jgi:hypothetical protein
MFSGASAQAHDLLHNFYDTSLTRRALGDAAVQHAPRLQPDLPEVHLANALHLYITYRDYERGRVQLAIAARGLPNSSDAYLLEAYMNRDPHNPQAITELANTLFSCVSLPRQSGQAIERGTLPLITRYSRF